MDPLAVARSYFDAWNARDPAAIAASFIPHGSYSDPAVSGLTPSATAEYAEALFAAFPDLAFDLRSIGAVSEDVVAAQWVMRGTNRGSYQGLPPTGAAVELPGADFIRVGDGGVATVTGYFDQRVVPDQLGLQVVVQPTAIGPFSFGVSVRAQGAEDAEPGAISLTVLEARSPEETLQIRELSRAVVQGLLPEPGFIGWLSVIVGPRMYTITAWRDAEAVDRLRENDAHNEAMRRFFGPELARGGQTGVWVPERLNGMWVRCDACGEMGRSAVGACRCGAELPAPPRWM